jgi:hypothetical protein
MARSNGLDLQATVSGHLRNMDFKLDQHEEWDHNNKIDFVITKFPRYPKVMSIGVQITGRLQDDPKRTEFVAKNDPSGGSITVASKALYLEIDESVDINRGGAELVANVLYAYQFDERFVDTRILAATIKTKNSSITYHFFDPRPTAQAPESVPSVTPPPVQGTRLANLVASASQIKHALAFGQVGLEGTLESYFTERGYGYIKGQDGSTYYMHINEVRDAILKGDLDALMKLPSITHLNHHVLFENAGKTKPDATYNSAKNVRLLLIG